MWAAERGHTAVVKTLIEKGAYVNDKQKVRSSLSAFITHALFLWSFGLYCKHLGAGRYCIVEWNGNVLSHQMRLTMCSAGAKNRIVAHIGDSLLVCLKADQADSLLFFPKHGGQRSAL
jgi:hypothetical protein